VASINICFDFIIHSIAIFNKNAIDRPFVIIPIVTDSHLENENSSNGIELTLLKDTFVFKKTRSNSRLVFKEAPIKKGETIVVGDASQIVRLIFDHRDHEFTPWLDNPEISHGDETSVRYIRTEDLPPDF